MVCISSYEEYINVAIYEVLLKFNLNYSAIEFEGATLEEQMAININASNSSSFSNFIILGHRIYFAIGNIIIICIGCLQFNTATTILSAT